MISARGLTRQFGAQTVVRDVTFDVSRGEIVALVGPNGAGKTTTLRMLAGLIAPTRGTVALDGVPLTRASGAALRRRVGFLPESPGLWDRLTVRENLIVYARLYEIGDRDRAIDAALARFELADRASARAAELSKGLRQMVALARALLHEPPILLLDEPSSGLDPEITRSVRRLLEQRRAQGCSILVSTHNLDEADRLADRVAVLHERLVAIDRPSTLRSRLTCRRLIVRVAGRSAAYLQTVRTIDPQASVDTDASLVLELTDAARQTPEVVAALVAAGAQVLEVRPEEPALEDVYLRLLHEP
jgi:ABC-2 type transport system ATP-binding protein